MVEKSEQDLRKESLLKLRGLIAKRLEGRIPIGISQSRASFNALVGSITFEDSSNEDGVILNYKNAWVHYRNDESPPSNADPITGYIEKPGKFSSADTALMDKEVAYTLGQLSAFMKAKGASKKNLVPKLMKLPLPHGKTSLLP